MAYGHGMTGTAATLPTPGPTVPTPATPAPGAPAPGVSAPGGASSLVRPARLTAHDLIELVIDPGSYQSWDTSPKQPNLGNTYRAELAAAALKSGVDESIITGEARINGRRVVVIVSEFQFLAGSLGQAAATRIVTALEHATRERLPVLASPASGGTRMQEGTLAFVAMVGIAAAVAAHQAQGLPYLVYLRHPSTGGALASFGSLGQVTVAEPGALIGFLGPRVYEAIYGEPFPAGVQSAENLAGHGVIDGVLPPRELRGMVERVLMLLAAPSRALLTQAATAIPGDRPAGQAVAANSRTLDTGPTLKTGQASPTGDETGSTWDSIQRSRRPNRPGLRELLQYAATDIVPLSGTGQGERDPGLTLALARIGQIGCVIVGQDRRIQARSPFGPAALRGARRAIRLANELDLPLVTVIDTPGAALSRDAEEGALAGEIARCLKELATRTGPTLSVLLGEGTGGGALALLPADRTIAAQHAWLSPLPPEGASAIMYRDTTHAAAIAQHQGVASTDLLAAGIVDRVVPEYPDAADEPVTFCQRVGATINTELASLLAQRLE